TVGKVASRDMCVKFFFTKLLPDRLAPVHATTQHFLENLASRISRHRPNVEGDVLWDFEISKSRPGKFHEFADVRLSSGLKHDRRAHFFAHHFVRDSQYCNLEHGRMGRERILYFNTIHIFAAPVHHVRPPIEDLYKALTVEPCDITGVQPTVDESLGGRLGLAPI